MCKKFVIILCFCVAFVKADIYADSYAESWAETKTCEEQKVNIRICELASYALNGYKAHIEMEKIVNKYDYTLGIDLSKDDLKFLDLSTAHNIIKGKDWDELIKQETIKLENFKKACELHKKLNENDKMYLHFKGLTYNNYYDVYDVNEFNEICK